MYYFYCLMDFDFILSSALWNEEVELVNTFRDGSFLISRKLQHQRGWERDQKDEENRPPKKTT